MKRPLTPRERLGLRVLGVLFAVVVAGIGIIQIVGNPIGGPCRDSYSCRGFLVGGAECVEDIGKRYCTRYCRTDADCPTSWRCYGANPTVLTIPTEAVGKICSPADR